VYNPALIAFSGATTPLGGFTVNFNPNVATEPNGFLRAALDLSGSTSLPSGPLGVASLQYAVPPAAPYASKEVLDLQNVSLNGGAIAVLDDDAVHVAAYLGDADGSRTLGSQDGSLAAQLAVGSGTGLMAYKLLDPLVLLDVNGSGALTAVDASLI